jgi:TatD DNase family protein
MRLVDTHSHLYLEQFNADLHEVLTRAAGAEIAEILLPNIDSQSIKPLKQLVSDFPGVCFPMMGLHPASVKDNYIREFEIIRNELLIGKYIAVGEIGIDLYWDKTFCREQSLVFEQEINLALEKEIPVVIHARESLDVIFEILEEFRGKGVKGIFHAFTGNIDQALRVIDLGFRIGIGGILTYKNSGLDKVVQEIDLNHILLETDAPFLPPVPKRGMRNEPAFLRYIAGTVARIKSVDIAEVARITSNNAYTLFRLNGEDEHG